MNWMKLWPKAHAGFLYENCNSKLFSVFIPSSDEGTQTLLKFSDIPVSSLEKKHHSFVDNTPYKQETGQEYFSLINFI